MKNEIKVSSFNIRVHTERDGINAFLNRADFLLEGIHEIDADIFGFQEVTLLMAEKLKTGMKGYSFVGVGRAADFTDEHTYIAYKTEKFDLLTSETFWLSETPDIPGSRFFEGQGDCPRICTLASLVHIDTKKTIKFYNTHLDYRGAPARLRGIRMILDRIRKDKLTNIDVITGDFNCRPDSEPVNEVNNSNLGLADATSELTDTYNSFGCEPESKIDYIFTNSEYRDSYKVRKITDEGMYLSDHDAVVTTLILK